MVCRLDAIILEMDLFEAKDQMSKIMLSFMSGDDKKKAIQALELEIKVMLNTFDNLIVD